MFVAGLRLLIVFSFFVLDLQLAYVVCFVCGLMVGWDVVGLRLVGLRVCLVWLLFCFINSVVDFACGLF